MRREELRVGMVVKANYESNDTYLVTTESSNCVGFVKEMCSNGQFELEVLSHKDTRIIGTEYTVGAKCFDEAELELEHLKVGMKVKANKRSNGIYCWTKEELGCVGVVREIRRTEFVIEITDHQQSGEIGRTYDVEPRYFDIYVESEKEEVVEEVKGEAKMVVELKKVDVVKDAKYGDIVVFEKGQLMLIVADSDKDDYRGVFLNELHITCYENDVEDLIDTVQSRYETGNVVRIIPARNIKLSEI